LGVCWCAGGEGCECGGGERCRGEDSFHGSSFGWG
jgi:hypothetical protein